jgi:ABC-2 type transport system permease protein
MKSFFALIKYNLLIYIQYPLELVNILLKEVVRIFFLFLFLQFVFQNAEGNDYTLRESLSYYLITGGIAEITLIFRQKLGSHLRDSIKSGEISNYLIKPIPLLSSMFAVSWGKRSLYNIVAALSIVIGFILTPFDSVQLYIGFFIFLILAFFIAFSINLLEGILTFYMESPGGIPNSIAHVGRLISGAMVPLSFFPQKIADILKLSPFAVAIYHPANILKLETLGAEQFNAMIIGLFWVLFLNGLALYFWNNGLKKYEAVGL